MGDAVAADSPYGRIATDDLTVTGGCRVTLVGSYHIRGKNPTQVGQTLDKFGGNRACIGTHGLFPVGKA